jgi:transcriptional regulator with XRE-family HTH domain
VQVDLAKIKCLRKQKGLTQKELARLLGFKSQVGYHYIESGKHQMKIHHLATLAKLLGVRMEDLLIHDQSKPQTKAVC